LTNKKKKEINTNFETSFVSGVNKINTHHYDSKGKHKKGSASLIMVDGEFFKFNSN